MQTDHKCLWGSSVWILSCCVRGCRYSSSSSSSYSWRCVVTIHSSRVPYLSSTMQFKKTYVKSFPSHKAHRAMVISVSLANNQTPVYTVRLRIQGECIVWCACLCPSFCWYSLCLLTDGWPGWVGLGGWGPFKNYVTLTGECGGVWLSMTRCDKGVGGFTQLLC